MDFVASRQWADGGMRAPTEPYRRFVRLPPACREGDQDGWWVGTADVNRRLIGL